MYFNAKMNKDRQLLWKLVLYSHPFHISYSHWLIESPGLANPYILTSALINKFRFDMKAGSHENVGAWKAWQINMCFDLEYFSCVNMNSLAIYRAFSITPLSDWYRSFAWWGYAILNKFRSPTILITLPRGSETSYLIIGTTHKRVQVTIYTTHICNYLRLQICVNWCIGINIPCNGFEMK